MDSPEYSTPLPVISPFLCTDSSEASNSTNGPPSQDPYVATISRHHSPFASSSSDHSLIYSSSFDTPNQAHRLARRRVPRLVCPPRSRSPIDYVPSSLLVVGLLAPTRADLLPSRKRFRDSYSSKASMEEDIEVGIVEVGVGLELVVGGINPMSAQLVVEESEDPARGDSSSSSSTRDGSIRSFEDMQIELGDDVHDFYHPCLRIVSGLSWSVMRSGGDTGGWSHLHRGVLDFARRMSVWTV
ncbi:hypothetical protein Tco_1257260 [Tanacetum coccineum]